MKEMDEESTYNDYNLERTCRTCAHIYKNEDLIPLFTARTSNKEMPVDLIKKFHTSDFQICIYDNLPKNICENCFANFKILYDFITLCEFSEKTLKNYFPKTEILDKNVDNSLEKQEYNIFENNSNNDFEENCLSTLKIETISNSEYINSDGSPIECYLENSFTDEEHLDNDDLDIIKNQPIFNDETVSNTKSLSNNDDSNFSLDTFKLSNSENNENLAKKFGKITCKICNISLYRRYYNSHLKKHQPIVFVTCKICDTIVEDIDMHSKSEHKIFVCKICDISFSNARKKRAHIFKMHDRSGYNCNICGRAFLFPNILKRHMEYVHSQNTPKAICDICGKLLKNESVLSNHRALHFKKIKVNEDDTRSNQKRSNINIFKCPFCSLKFRNLFGLKNHSKFHHKDKNSENYKHVCKFCNQRFKRSDHLELHIDLVHLKNLPFTCSYCSKRFPKQYVLNQHVRKMHTEGPRECQYCNKPYLSQSSLNRHIKLNHLKEKYFKCDICSEVFSTVHKYQTHMKSHTVEEEKETAQRIYAEILHNKI